MNKASDSSEILRLRKELIHAKTQVTDLQEELEEKTNLYIKAISDRDQFKEKLNNAKDSIHRVENIVQSKVNLALDKERKELAKLREDNELLRKRIELFDQEKLNSSSREKQLQDKINGLTQDLQFYARNVDMRDCMNRIELLRVEKDAKENKLVEQLQFINKLSHQVEDLTAENRTLRKMANVPENYGINLEQIKLHDREKIDDYKKLIRVLQEDNYKLEEERARLKHMLKQQSMLYKTDEPVHRYKNLNPEQLFKVDQYVLKLLAGETEEPADFYKLKKENQNLKAQLEALNTKGFDFAKAQIEAFLKELGLGDSGKFFDKLMSGNEELKKMIKELLSKGFMVGGDATGKTTSVNPYGSYGRFRPPVPSVGADGDINNGFSYKFQTHLDVADKDGRSGLADQTKYDVAFMQLCVMECVELLKRKDEELTIKNNEIDSLYVKVRDYLLVQDQIYKDYIKMEKNFNTKQEELQITLRNTRDSLHEEQLKVKSLENLNLTLQKGLKNQSIEMRLIELTKQNSILDINLLRLTRKYQILQEQEEILRREYHNKEAELAEKDRYVQLRINMLKQWKANAIQQLKFLFTKLRLAVPRTEYQSVQSENEILKQKNADFIDRNSKLAERVSQYQTKVRQNMEAEEKYKVLMEMKEDLENDYEVLKMRLEQVDQQFKWENAVFNKVVALLKRYKVSPQQAFEEFDKNKDGKLGRQEFMLALEMLKINDLSNQEVDILMGSIDVNHDGTIQYKEFVRKLSRHGVKSRTSEEQIIYLLIESLKRSGVRRLSDAFELFDKERRGSLSREDFKDVFKNMKLRIEDADIEKFIEHFWKDQKAGIDYEAFLRIFNRYQIRLEDDESRRKKTHKRIPDDVLRLKKRIYMEMQNAFNKTNKSIKNLYDKIDLDQSNQIEYDEFKAMFEKMKIKMTEGEILNIFNSIDFDDSGKITFPEFVGDFEKTVKTDIQTLIKEEKERIELEQTENSYSMTNTAAGAGTRNEDQMRNATIVGGAGTRNQEIQAQTRIAILEAREKQMGRKLETSMRILNHAQQSQLESQNQYDQLEKRWNDLTEQFHLDKERIRTLEENLRLSIKKDEAMRLQELNEKLRTELTENKAAMNTYKNMTEVISDQVKGLKLIIERKKDENENLVNAVREISSQSEDQKRLGKLYYLVMLSRWQEAAVNKKYDMILTENKELRKELMNNEQILQDKEKEHHECENLLQDTHLTIEKIKKQIVDSRNIFLTLEKADELNHIITEISNEKTDLEEQYFEMRSKYTVNQLMMDESISKAEHYQELLEVLQKSKQSELSDRLISLSEKLQGIKLSEMRSTREAEKIKEKNNYISRLMRTQNDQIRKLEEHSAELESKIHKKEEEFRKADNDRMRRFFNARFDDIPGALQGGDGKFPSSARHRNNGFNDSDGFQNYNQRSARKQDDVFSPSGHSESYTIPLGGHGMGRQNSNVQGGDPKFLEGKVKKLEAELNKALEEIRTKELIINRFKEWQLADKYLAEDEVLRDAIENQRSKVTQVHEQESKEMAEAAAQMVKTLQEMLDQKNEQLKSKEEMIARIREHTMVQREQDGIEIARLQQQLSLAAGTTLSKLQEIVVKNEHGYAGGSGIGSRYDKLTREELSRTLDDKDHVIQRQAIEVKGLHEQLQHMKEKNLNLNDQILDLQNDLYQEKQQVELKAKVKELERIKKELHEKDKKNENLRQAIDKLNDRMQSYEIQKSDLTEDQKMIKISEDLKKKEHDTVIKKMKDKMAMVESSRDQRAEELKKAKVREQEMKEEIQKLILERDEYQKALKQTRDRLDQEIRQREKLQIEVNQVKGQISVGRGLGSSTGPTYEQLLARNKELENDNIILQCQQKTVVVYNKESGTFEYVGEPISLNFDREITDIEEFIVSIKSWIQRNERLTLKSIFESIDKENFGELSESKFESAMHKLGISLRQQEKRMLKDVLDPRNIGFIKYRPLVKELSGIPQLDFIIKEVQKLSKLAETRDLNDQEFKKLIDPQRLESMNLTQLQESIKLVANEQFQMSNDEVEYLFKNVTKSVRTVGVTISINKLTEKVFTAVDALLIEKMKENVAKSLRPLSELFSRHDSNKDNCLEYAELENLLLECQIAFKPDMLKRIYNLMDPGRRSSKITLNTIKFYLSDVSFSVGASSSINMPQRSYDFEPSLQRVNLSEESTSEEMSICRSGARKILQHFQSSLIDQLNTRDKYTEGIISREDVQKCIEENKVPELQSAELNILMKYADRGSKGFISIVNFIEKLQELATETKQDANLRGFATNAKRQGINLKQELFKYDSTRTGRLDKKTFSKAMNQLPVSLTDDQVDMLFQSGELPEFRGTLDIKHFLDRVAQAQKYKPLQQTFQQTGSQLKQPSKVGTGKQPAQQQTGAFENWEAEKKYKTKLVALQQQIEESKKETQATEKQAKHWQEMANKLEKEKNSLQARLVDINAKPPKAATYESLNQAQLENMQQLKDQVFYLQEENSKLEKIIQVELKSEISKLSKENDKIADKNKHLQDEVKRNEYQVNRLIGKPMDNIEKREEGELSREKKIIELEKEIKQREDREYELQDQLFKTEEKLLDLKFQKETFDLQFARLQKRITDLEQYKLASSQFSSVLKKQNDQEQEKIEEISNTIGGLTGPGQSKKNQDTVKLRTKSSKSIAELEMLIESLKRVIEKQKSENDSLKKQVDHYEQQKDKLKSEKQLRQKIESLSQEVHSYEMKDVNLSEKEKTIKKLIEANRQLREDLNREAERYGLLENKYKDILVKYNILAKENAKNTEMLFAMNTGGNIHNYSGYLMDKDSSVNKSGNRKREASASKKVDPPYDRNFEDVF